MKIWEFKFGQEKRFTSDLVKVSRIPSFSRYLRKSSRFASMDILDDSLTNLTFLSK